MWRQAKWYPHHAAALCAMGVMWEKGEFGPASCYCFVEVQLSVVRVNSGEAESTHASDPLSYNACHEIVDNAWIGSSFGLLRQFDWCGRGTWRRRPDRKSG